MGKLATILDNFLPSSTSVPCYVEDQKSSHEFSFKGRLSEFIWPSVAVVSFSLLSQTCLDQKRLSWINCLNLSSELIIIESQLILAESNHTDFFLNWTDEPYIQPLCFWFSWSKRLKLPAGSCLVLILFSELSASDERLA
ncbi:hypothetical protein F2Q70_00014637 [Brassica cretica]|uniref:Uncharacterized protein n=1 Tax=Brassica cretica TaxID=69181 RepID=A0A8S9I324_BRACR|nr:hypothetical protein F2Q70_00014637 [Brassica cretica]